MFKHIRADTLAGAVRYAVAALSPALVLAAFVPCVGAQTLPVPVEVVITGRVSDARKMPIVGAVITARGDAIGWTATLHDGSFRLALPAGTYEILVRKGGYRSSTVSILVSAGSPKNITVALGEANSSSVDIAGAKSNASVPFNSGVSATTSLSTQDMRQRSEPSVSGVALELAGVTLAHPAASVPDTSFVVRGGTDETRVQIDGHAVNAGATGRWNSSYAALALFDTIEVVKGAGISGANAGESVFGTINMRTRDFAPGHQADLVTGTDSFGGSFSTVTLSGNAFQNDRLSYKSGTK